jgi:hypothetical protein
MANVLQDGNERPRGATSLPDARVPLTITRDLDGRVTREFHDVVIDRQGDATHCLDAPKIGHHPLVRFLRSIHPVCIRPVIDQR